MKDQEPIEPAPELLWEVLCHNCRAETQIISSSLVGPVVACPICGSIDIRTENFGEL